MLSRLNFNLFTTNLVVLGVWRSRTRWPSVTKTKCGRCARAASNCSSRCLFHSFRRRKHDWPSPFEMKKKKKKKKNQRHGRGPSYSPWFLFRATTVHRSVYRMNIEATFIASVQNGVHTWLVLVSIRVICLLLQKNVKLASVWDASFNSVVGFFFCVCVWAESSICRLRPFWESLIWSLHFSLHLLFNSGTAFHQSSANEIRADGFSFSRARSGWRVELLLLSWMFFFLYFWWNHFSRHLNRSSNTRRSRPSWLSRCGSSSRRSGTRSTDSAIRHQVSCCSFLFRYF